MTYIQVRRFVSKTYFSTVSTHFYSLAPTWNKCVYALSVPYFVLRFVSSSKRWTQVSSAVTIRDK
jgi:hypothetical protein